LTKVFQVLVQQKFVGRWELNDSPARSLVKAISWRVTGTIDTFIISWVITGQLLFASGIALTEVITKIALFWAHERAWNRVSWGRD
jgi:uncharacterized membrane protein